MLRGLAIVTIVVMCGCSKDTPAPTPTAAPKDKGGETDGKGKAKTQDAAPKAETETRDSVALHNERRIELATYCSAGDPSSAAWVEFTENETPREKPKHCYLPVTESGSGSQLRPHSPADYWIDIDHLDFSGCYDAPQPLATKSMLKPKKLLLRFPADAKDKPWSVRVRVMNGRAEETFVAEGWAPWRSLDLSAWRKPGARVLEIPMATLLKKAKGWLQLEISVEGSDIKRRVDIVWPLSC